MFLASANGVFVLVWFLSFLFISYDEKFEGSQLTALNQHKN